MGIEDWAAKHGQTPKAHTFARSWFAEHPQVVAECQDARLRGWSWQQITDYITDAYGYPLRDPKGVARECQS